MQIKRWATLSLLCLARIAVPYSATKAHSEQSEDCQGSACLQILDKRVGHRCNSVDSVDVSIQNISKQNLRGYVVFEMTNGKKHFSPTGLMHPGDKQALDGPQYDCHSTGEVFTLANTGADPKYPPQDSPTEEQSIRTIEFGASNSAPAPSTLPNHHEESSLVQLNSGKLGQATDAPDGVATLPIPEYVYYTLDATACPAEMHNGQLTKRFALYIETGSARLTVKDHRFVQESDNLTSRPAGCIYPDQIKPSFHFKTKSAVLGDKG
jgi:hypothetical protein